MTLLETTPPTTIIWLPCSAHWCPALPVGWPESALPTKTQV